MQLGKGPRGPSVPGLLPSERGRDFFSRLAEQGGEKAMHDAMRGEPMKLKDFARLAVAKPAADAKPDAEPPKKVDGK